MIFLMSGLHQREARAVDDADHRERHHERGEQLSRLGKTAGKPSFMKPYVPILSSTSARIAEPAVGALDVGVRQPGVQRTDRT